MIAYNHALPGRQAIGLDDDGLVFPFIQIVGRAVRIPKTPILGRLYVSVSQNGFAKNLAGLELGRLLGRSEDAQLFRGKRIRNPVCQGPFRADDGQLDLVLLGEIDQVRKVIDADIYVLCILCRPRVSRRNKYAIGAGLCVFSRLTRALDHRCQQSKRSFIALQQTGHSSK